MIVVSVWLDFCTWVGKLALSLPIQTHNISLCTPTHRTTENNDEFDFARSTVSYWDTKEKRRSVFGKIVRIRTY